MSQSTVMVDEIEAAVSGSAMLRAEPFVAALRVGALFADAAYQRALDADRSHQLIRDLDRTLLGFLEVSARNDGRYAILDGQQRCAAVAQVHGRDEPVVCRVHSGLTLLDEATLYEQLHTARRGLTWWDRWRERRAAGDPVVLAVDDVLERHRLQVNPAPEDGNVRATKALETVLGERGDPRMLDAVLEVLTSAFGSSVDAFDGALMQGVALVLERYDAAELDAGRLATQLQSIPPRQLRARAIALREVHRTTVPRLCAAVVVERYNAGRGRKIQPFFERQFGKRITSREPGGTMEPALRQSSESSPIGRGPADPVPSLDPATAYDAYRVEHALSDGEDDECDESPEIGVSDPRGVRRALRNGRGLRWVMNTYGLDYPTAKAIRDELAAA